MRVTWTSFFMFNTTKLSANERARVFDYLIFKIKHGGNVVNALKSYMDGNRSKDSRPVQKMLDKINISGHAFVDVALEFGLIDHAGYLILASSVEPAKALPVIRGQEMSSSFGVTSIILTDIAKKWATALVFAILLLVDVTRQPMVYIFEKMNQAAVAAGSKPDPLPSYLANLWLVSYWVLGVGAVFALVIGVLWWLNKFQTATVYRLLRYRFYEDWVGLLSLYLAFKAAGQSDFKAAKSLASSCPEGSFTANLFNEMADSIRKKGSSFYEVLAAYDGAFPPAVLSFFLDASKTGQVDAYMLQAKAYCAEQLVKVTEKVRVWVPALTGILMLMTFGLMVADLFVSITTVSMKPLTG